MIDKGVICYNISYHNENPILPTLLTSKNHNETDLTIADIITWKSQMLFHSNKSYQIIKVM